MNMEDSVGEFYLQYTLMLFVFLLLGVTIFLGQYTQSVDFKSYVNTVIQRDGGLTSTAQAEIEHYSNEHFNGRYSVMSLSGNDKKPYGSVINYQITGKIKLYFFNLPAQSVITRGATVSLVR